MASTSNSFGTAVLSTLVDFSKTVVVYAGRAVAALLRPIYPSVSVVRAQDHLLLRFEFVNLSRQDVTGEDGEPAQVLVPKGGEDAYLIVHFPPQNLAEQAFFETADEFPTVKGAADDDPDEKKPGKTSVENPEEPTNNTPPVKTRLARPSRLVFKVPSSADPIPYTIEGLLEACSELRLAVAPSATVPDPPPKVRSLVATLDFADYQAWASRSYLIEQAAQAGLISVGASSETAAPAWAAGQQAFATPDAAGSPDQAIPSPAERILVESRYRTWKAKSRIGQGFSDPAGVAAEPAAALPEAAVGPSMVKYLPKLRRPGQLETALETPYRLIISPHRLSAWVHAFKPVVSSKDRYELWHTRLAYWIGSSVREDPDTFYLRAVRAIWARDWDPCGPRRWDSPPPRLPFEPFRMSLDGSDRHQIVHLSGNHRLWYEDSLSEQKHHEPDPIAARRLMLSSLGAWMDTRGAWDPPQGLSLEEWRHRAAMGRDNYVRVVYRGFLFPFGHRASLIKITERKFDHELNGNPAYLRQRMFIVVREPEKSYPKTGLTTTSNESYDRQWPIVNLRITTLTTPKLDAPQDSHIDNKAQDAFLPKVNKKAFLFNFIGEDREGNEFVFDAPAIFISTLQEYYKNPSILDAAVTAYEDVGTIDLNGQTVTFAASKKPGDTGFETQSLTFSAEVPIGDGAGSNYHRLVQLAYPGLAPRFYPAVREAKLQIPAVQHLVGKSNATVVKFNQTYLVSGFAAAANKGQVFLELDTSQAMSFDSQGDRSGGLVKPNMNIQGLSRTMGPVGGDLSKLATNNFDPADFFGGLGAKVFGVIDLWDLINVLKLDNLDLVPKFITEALTPLQALVTFVESFKQNVDSVSGLGTVVSDVSNDCTAVLGDLANIISDLPSVPLPSKVAALKADLNNLLAHLAVLDSALPAATGLSDELRRDLEKDIARLKKDLASVTDFVDKLVQALQTITELTVRFEWKPKMRDWPSTKPLFVAKYGSDDATLTIAAEMSAKSGLRAAPSFDISCSLQNFSLDLIALIDASVLKIGFKKLEFSANSATKADVNVEMGEITFVGVLSFIEELKKLIPLDGFSDPPSLEVTKEGVKAGFSLALPDVSFGVFCLQNLSLGASLTVPFLIDPLSLRFNFCDRHSPFLLTVSALGGGGFAAITLDPSGFQMLEVALEFGACVAVSFAVASGSVSVVAGIYFKLEKITVGAEEEYGVVLAGYFRLRGEVDVLGIISASIELYLEMTYVSKTGKVVGKATLTIEITVLFFSASVSITCERRFAGSNGDPTFAELMAPYTDPVLGYVEPWATYCEAFA